MPLPEPLVTRLNDANSEKIRKISTQTNKSSTEIINTIIEAVQLYDETTTIMFDPKASITPTAAGPKLRFRRTITFK
jgi:hypothetical protein